MAWIPLSRGLVALIDDADLAFASQWRWHARAQRRNGKIYYYAARSQVQADGRRAMIYLHRELLGLAPGDRRLGDHRNNDTLDNRRQNLRAASGSLNVHNQAARSAAGFKGVTQVPSGAFMAQIKLPDGNRHLGNFRTAEEAARAFDLAAFARYGDSARLNFPARLGEPPPTPIPNLGRRSGTRARSGYRGVTKCKGRWRAMIERKGTAYYLGTYDTPEEAARAYDAKAAELHGEFAALNFAPEAVISETIPHQPQGGV